MRLSTFSFASIRDNDAEADLVSRKLLGMPIIVTDRASGERSVWPMEDVEAELRGAA